MGEIWKNKGQSTWCRITNDKYLIYRIFKNVNFKEWSNKTTINRLARNIQEQKALNLFFYKKLVYKGTKLGRMRNTKKFK